MVSRGLFVGLTTVDIQYFVESHPLENSKVKAKEKPFVVAGGPAANAAVAFCVLNGEADFLTCIGENAFRRVLSDDFMASKVKVVDALSEKKYDPVIASVLTNTSNSDRTIITHHPGAVEVESFYDNLKIEDYDFVFTDGFYPELAVPVCQKANRLGIPVIFDGGSWKPQMPEILPWTDIAICSANYIPPGCSTMAEIIDFTQNFGVGHVAISRGEKPIYTHEGEITIEKVCAVDSLGAGDFLHGAFCWYYMQSNNFMNSLQKASELATFSTQFRGTRSWIERWKNDL
ncbi:MAG TPA: PfkB family carbohydrate kinase [Prolixibacteraceae bacterium]|nr:PfkB family carbohydrate kinase [Prolixibacteraceae bacterium]